MDRRAYPRAPMRMTALLEHDKGQTMGIVEDGSLNGMCIRTPEPLQASSITGVKLKLCNGEELSMSCLASVVRRNGNQLGIHIDFFNIETFLHWWEVIRSGLREIQARLLYEPFV